MRMVDIIERKKEGKKLTEEEISFFVKGIVDGSVPDYQASAFLMAVVFRGMDEEETSYLTKWMMNSGDVLDLSDIPGIKLDKHSTGGVGDKTSLSLMPLVASFGCKVAKMSGRGLGHTGGTLDKMESVPGTNVYLSEEAFKKQVRDIGIAIAGQTSEIDPADKKLYALRDVTSTVESIPLIASSIMSKKLASGSDAILLDVKYGKGAFMKDVPSARALATLMIKIGRRLGKDVRAIISGMEEPLGKAVGNALEVKEAIATLRGEGPADFVELIENAGAILLNQGQVAKDLEEGKKLIREAIDSGQGLAKLKELFAAEGGDASYIDHPEKFPTAAYEFEIRAKEGGFVEEIDSLSIGHAAMLLGAGRSRAEDHIDFAAGIYLEKKVGDEVAPGEVLARAYSNKEAVKEALAEIEDAYVIASEQPPVLPLIREYIEA